MMTRNMAFGKFVLICFVLCLPSLVQAQNSIDPNKFLPSIYLLLDQEAREAKIDAVFFAQTHVEQSQHEYFGLVSEREALLKVHVIGPPNTFSPNVEAVLNLDGRTMRLRLSGPPKLPTFIAKQPGRVQHSFGNSFTNTIPKQWVKPGLTVSIKAGAASLDVPSILIGAPTDVLMTMFDIHYFQLTPGDYPNGWQEELEAKWPVADLRLRRVPNIVFDQLIIPARSDVNAPVVKVSSTQDYRDQTGLRFDGEQAAALQWNAALKRAAGIRGRISLYYTNIYGVNAGGQAGGFAGVGNGRNEGVLHHELGHALSLPHWGGNSSYPYKGDMFGIKAPNIFNATHAGPTWAYDLRLGKFIPATVQSNAVPGNSVVGTYKADPMQGGGSGDQEFGFIFRHFADYSVRQMRNYLENHVLIWNASLNSYASWDQNSKDYTDVVTNNGVNYPIERDVSVVSLMASVSSVDNVSHVYPPIGPYLTGIIRLFDPSVEADRMRADTVFCPTDGCDASLRVTQNGQMKTYMLAAVVDPSASPLDARALSTQAINLKSDAGPITRVQLLLTPDVEKNGLPSNPIVLSQWVAP